mmetsp:Transcript_16702/g.23214  ORF Transcript_16702/g.23214 Transcript_16702/m.23214 type:complete len:221 (+) Transcript_16702:77-739(+)
MSSQYTIYCYPHAPNVFKALIAGKYGGVSMNYPQDFKMGTDNKTPEYLKKNPLGQVPLMDTPEGPIFESNAISRYIARVGNASTTLLGKNAYEQSVIDQWIEFTNDFLTTTFYLWGHIFGLASFDKEKFDSTKEKVARAFGALETTLSSRISKYLVNDSVTLADITVASLAMLPLKTVLEKEFRAAYPKTEAYLASLYALPQFKEVVGDVAFVEKYTPPS